MSIVLEMFASGGVMTIAMTNGEHRVLLAERRFALACALFAPAAVRTGDFIPDEVIIGRVWPSSSSADRGDLNQLVFRLRADLKSAASQASS